MAFLVGQSSKRNALEIEGNTSSGFVYSPAAESIVSIGDVLSILKVSTSLL